MKRDNFYGELAQLGERLPCTQEVSGSIPLFSTKKSNISSKKDLNLYLVSKYRPKEYYESSNVI